MGCAAALAQTASGCFYNASSHLSIQWDLKGKSAAYSSSNMLINEKFIEMYLFFFVPTCCGRRPSDQTFLWLLGDVRRNQRAFLSPTVLPKRRQWSPALFPIPPSCTLQLSCPGSCQCLTAAFILEVERENREDFRSITKL